VVKEENYSIQAKNLMEMIIKDCENSLMNFQRDNFLIGEIKKLRFNINNRIRKISDLSELKTDLKSNSFKVIVFNTDYMEIITEQLNELSLDYSIDGQYIFIKKKELTFNQLLSIVDEIKKFETKNLTKCTKAKLEPVLRARNAVENDFIDQIVSRETSKACEQIYLETESKIHELCENRIKKLLGKDLYKKYVDEVK